MIMAGENERTPMRHGGTALAATATIILGTVGTLGAATGTAGARVGPLTHSTPDRASSKPRGFVYAGTFTGAIDILAVEPNWTLKLIGSEPTAAPRNEGLAILHTPAGVRLYAIQASSVVGSLYEFSVNTKTGKLTADNSTPVPDIVPTESGSGGLLAYDGYATNKSDKSTLFAEACTTDPCGGQTGPVQFSINPQTGAPKLVGGLPSAVDEFDESINRNDLDILASAKGGGAQVDPIEVAPKTGKLIAGKAFFLTYGSSQTPASAESVGTGVGRIALGRVQLSAGVAGVAVDPSSGLGIAAGQGANVANSDYQLTALKFLPHILLAAETNIPTYAPQLEFFSPDGCCSQGTINLGDAPFNLRGGTNQDADSPTDILTLGKGLYLSTSLGGVIQATDGVGGKGVEVNKTTPEVNGTFEAYSIAGFLKPHKKKTAVTLHVHLAGGKVHVSGVVSAGVAGVKVVVKLERLSSGSYATVHTAKAKLSGAHKYATSFNPAKKGSCRAVARYPGTSTTTSSSASKKFAC
jgi:hypothetical protein